MPKDKDHINLIVIGHIDHGKSTLFGDVLVEIGAIPEKVQRELEKLAKEYGKPSWKPFIVDRLKEERQGGITIQLAFESFETKSKSFTLIDAPGHRDFVKNMITGASQADAAVLVISGKKGEAEVGCAPNGQTREHAYLAQTLGVKEIIVAVNKADMWNYEEERFNAVKTIALDLLRNIGFNVKKIKFIPTSGITGDNILKKSDKMPWYDGRTLIEALDELEIPEKPIDAPLRVPIQDVYTIKGHGTVPVGKVISGVLKVGDKVIINPGGFQGEVRSIEQHHESIKTAEPGANIGFSIRGLTKRDIGKGDVLGHIKNPPQVINSGKDHFIGHIIVINHPTAICNGYTPVFHLGTSHTAIKFLELISKIDKKTGSIIESKPKFLKNGDSAIVKLKPIKKLCAELYSEFPDLGRFAIRDMGRTIAVGIIKKIESS